MTKQETTISKGTPRRADMARAIGGDLSAGNGAGSF
jgi:hypothetical protein